MNYYKINWNKGSALYGTIRKGLTEQDAVEKFKNAVPDARNVTAKFLT